MTDCGPGRSDLPVGYVAAAPAALTRAASRVSACGNGRLWARDASGWRPVVASSGKTLLGWRGGDLWDRTPTGWCHLWPSAPVVDGLTASAPVWQYDQAWAATLTAAPRDGWGIAPVGYVWRADGVLLGSTTAPTLTVTHPGGGTVRYSVEAVDGRGQAAAVRPTVDVTYGADPRPPAPTVTGAPWADGRTVTWTWPAVPGATGYEVNDGSKWTPVAGTSWTGAGYPPGSPVTVQVRAVNASGRGPAGTGAATTGPIPPPTAVSAAGVGSSQVRLNWNPTGPGSQVALDGVTGWIDVGAARTYLFSGLAENTTYTARVRTVDGGFPSTAVAVAATTGNAPPTPPGDVRAFWQGPEWNRLRLVWGDYPQADLNRLQVFVNGVYQGDVPRNVGYWDYLAPAGSTWYELGVRSVDNGGLVSPIVSAWAATQAPPPVYVYEAPVPWGVDSEFEAGAGGAPTVDGNVLTGWVSAAKGSAADVAWWQGLCRKGTLAGVRLFIAADAPYTCWASFGIMPNGGWNNYGAGTIPLGPPGVAIWQQRDGMPAGQWVEWMLGDQDVPVNSAYGLRLTWANLGSWRGSPPLAGLRANLMEVQFIYRA